MNEKHIFNKSINGVEEENTIFNEATTEKSTSEFNKILDMCINETCEKNNSHCKGCREEKCLNKTIIKKFENFINEYDRLPYSVITSKVFDLSDQEFDNLSARADAILDFLRDRGYGEIDSNDSKVTRVIKVTKVRKLRGSRKEKGVRKAIEEKKIVEVPSEKNIFKLMFKFRDHVNLANIQLEAIKKISDSSLDDVREQFKEESMRIANSLYEASTSLNTKVDETEEKISDAKKELYSQLISIVSIFVAIAFVMFGGISLMNNLFDYSGLERVPIMEMICAGALIGIVMILSLYAFIIFVLHVTGKLDYIEEDNKKVIRAPYRNLTFASCGILVVVMVVIFLLNMCQQSMNPQQQIKESKTVQKIVVQPDQDNNSNQEGESTGNNQSIETNKK